MTVPAEKPEAFWDDLEQRVVASTETVLNASDRRRAPVISYLREVEEMARRECDRRRTIQVIASARRVLGDRSAVGPTKGPFARTLGDR